MSNKEIFIQYVEEVMKNSEMPEGAVKYFESLKESKEKIKPPVSHLGYLILEVMKTNPKNEFTAKMLGEAMSQIGRRYISGRTASGATRALIAKGLIQKVENSKPIAYTITQLGMESKFNDPDLNVEVIE